MLKNGYWTFKQLRQKLESHGLVVEDFPDGRIQIKFGKSVKSFNPWKLGHLLGYTTFSELHPGQHPVDIHEGLRYVTIGCNLANRSQNINPDGYPSSIISSLPIDGTKPLFGTTTKYNDIESEDFRSLAACYITTFKSGISENHLNNTLSDSHLITSIVKFHVHYQMEKFMKDPKLLDHYLNEDDLHILGKYMPTTETWERRTLSSHANIGTWYYGLPTDTRRIIRNQRYVRTR
ncbi:Hypothetical predicted protein, partial [Paramuricea clavata]